MVLFCSIGIEHVRKIFVFLPDEKLRIMNKTKISRLQEVYEILENTQVCTLAMIDEEEPYAVPMNFGVDNGYIYFHGAAFGRKIDILQRNPLVTAVFYSDAVLHVRHEQVACSYSMKFKSVIVNGSIQFVDDPDEKQGALNSVMKKFSDRGSFKYNAPALHNVNVFKLKIEKFTAFKRGY